MKRFKPWRSLAYALCCSVFITQAETTTETRNEQAFPYFHVKEDAIKPSLKSVGDIEHPTLTDVMASGQLGGILHPNKPMSFNVPLDKTLDAHVASYVEDNKVFARAMDEWNLHNYKKAFSMMDNYLQRFPNGLWAAEADLHMGCEARFNGRYREANERFSRINNRYGKSDFKGAQRVAEKAKSRLAVLKVMENNLSEATRLFSELKEEGSDWRQRTYASSWIQRISRLKGQGMKLADCGTQALSHVLENKGFVAEAKEVKALKPSVEQGFNIENLKQIAGDFKQSISARNVALNDLSLLPLPAIAHVDRSDTGGLGHYWIIESANDKEVVVFDKQKNRRFKQTLSEFEMEWSGNVLVFADNSSLPGK